MVLALHNISKSYGAVKALDRLSIDIYPGENVLLLGANGAGKSTLLRVCAGLVRADKGTVSLDNRPLLPREAGYIGHALQLYSDLSIEENLTLFANLLKCKVDLDSYLDQWDIFDKRHQQICNLSKGLAQRVSLARTFLGNPRVLLLDEPTAALDERAFLLFSKRLEALSLLHNGTTICLIVTHDISRLSAIAKRVIVLESGKVHSDTHTNDLSAPLAVEEYRKMMR